jgi:hypothetical protein
VSKRALILNDIALFLPRNPANFVASFIRRTEVNDPSTTHLFLSVNRLPESVLQYIPRSARY